MDASQDDKEVNSLEGPDTGTANPTPDSGTATSADARKIVDGSTPPHKKEKLGKRVRALITRINIYFLLFILIVILAGAIVFISLQRSKREAGETAIESKQLTSEELSKINDGNAKVGDPKQTLTIESNSVFSGMVLVRGSLDVAGDIKVGAALNVPGLNVSGASVLGQVAANELTVAGTASIQGQFNVQGNAAFSGTGSFGGVLSAPQINIKALQISGDLELGRHIDAGGSTPSKSNGPSLGSGGTSSISGTDTAGTLSINTGSGAGSGCFATITFSQSFSDTPHVVISPVGSAASSIGYYVNRSSTSFSICTSTPPPAGASFAFDYMVID